VEKITVALELPKSVLAALGVPESELAKVIRELIAAELYRQGRISLGKVAEIAEIPMTEIPTSFARYNLYIRYSAEDAAADWKGLREGLEV
jgi:predicted HTH domain antitoxin